MSCPEHKEVIRELETCKQKISVFEVLMRKIDEELIEIKNKISHLSDKIEELQKKTAEMPLKIIMIAVSIGAGVSTVLTFIILLITRLTGIL